MNNIDIEKSDFESLEIKPIENLFAEAIEDGDMEKFGEHLKRHLDSRGVSLTDFADEIGLSRPTVYRMFSNDANARKQSFDKVLSGVGMKLSVVPK